MKDKKTTNPREKIVRVFKRLGYDLNVSNPRYPDFAPLAIIAGNISKPEQERIIARLKKSLQTYHDWQDIEFMAMLNEDKDDPQSLINRLIDLSWERRAKLANTTDLLMFVLREGRVAPELRKQALQKLVPYSIRDYKWWKEQSTYTTKRACPRETIDIVLERLVDLVPDVKEGLQVLSAINENTTDPKDSKRIALRERLKDRMVELTATFEQAEQQWQIARGIGDEKRVRLLLEKAYETANKLHHWMLIPEMVATSWQLFPSFKENPPDIPELHEAILSMLPHAQRPKEYLEAYGRTFYLRKEYAYNCPTTEQEREETVRKVQQDIFDSMIKAHDANGFTFWKETYDEAEGKKANARNYDNSRAKSLLEGIQLLQDAATARMRANAKTFEERKIALQHTKDKEQQKEQLIDLAKKAKGIYSWEEIYKLATELGVLELQITARKRVKAILFAKRLVENDNFSGWKEQAEKEFPRYAYILGPEGRTTLERILTRKAQKYEDWRFLLQWSTDEKTKKLALKRITALVRPPKKSKKPSTTKES
jgi:hypothetical protein